MRLAGDGEKGADDALGRARVEHGGADDRGHSDHDAELPGRAPEPLHHALARRRVGRGAGGRRRHPPVERLPLHRLGRGQKSHEKRPEDQREKRVKPKPQDPGDNDNHAGEHDQQRVHARMILRTSA